MAFAPARLHPGLGEAQAYASVIHREMPRLLSSKTYLPGGTILCAFPVIVLLVMHVEQKSLPMPFPILFALLFLHGFRVVIWSLFKLDFDGALSWVVDAAGAAGFAVFAFWIAVQEREGWTGGLALMPDSWKQRVARILFACGGLLGALFAVRCLRKAFRRHRNRPDDAIRHI